MKLTVLVTCLTGILTLNAQNTSLDWAGRMGGASNDEARSVAVDAAGNVYTAGNYNGTADFDPGVGTYTLPCLGGSDVFISKVDASGNFLWAKQLAGTSTDFVFALTTDAAGNVYSSGHFSGTADFDPGAATYTLSASGTQDVFISKLDAAGNFVWAKQLGGAGASVYGSSIMLDPSGGVHIIGNLDGTADFDPGVGTYTLSSGTNSSACMIKLDASGSFIWAKQYSGSSYTYATQITTDANGNTYVTGTFGDVADFDAGSGTFMLTATGVGADVFITKTDAAGNFVWAKNIGGDNILSLFYRCRFTTKCLYYR